MVCTIFDSFLSSSMPSSSQLNMVSFLSLFFSFFPPQFSQWSPNRCSTCFSFFHLFFHRLLQGLNHLNQSPFLIIYYLLYFTLVINFYQSFEKIVHLGSRELPSLVVYEIFYQYYQILFLRVIEDPSFNSSSFRSSFRSSFISSSSA